MSGVAPEWPGGCDLHIPHKNWAAGDPRGELERQNYLEMERWSQRLKACMGGGTCDCGVGFWGASNIPISFGGGSDGYFNRGDQTLNTICGVTEQLTQSAIILVSVEWAYGVMSPTAGYVSTFVNSEGMIRLGSDVPVIVPATTVCGLTQNQSLTFFGSRGTPSYNLYLTQYTDLATVNVNLSVQEFYLCCGCVWTD